MEVFKNLSRKLGGTAARFEKFHWQEKNREVMELINAGRIDEAEILCRRIVEFVDHKHKTDAREKATTYNNMGMIFLMKGDYDLADECFRDALAMRKRLFGHDHNEVAVVLLNLVELYKRQAREILAANRVETSCD